MTAIGEIEQLWQDALGEPFAYLGSTVNNAYLLGQKPRPIIEHHEHGQSRIVKPSSMAQVNYDMVRCEALSVVTDVKKCVTNSQIKYPAYMDRNNVVLIVHI